MTERRWHDHVPGYGRRHHREVVRDDGTIETTMLIPVLTLARRARTGEKQEYMRRVDVTRPSTPEEVERTQAAIREMLAEIEAARERSRREMGEEPRPDDRRSGDRG